MSTRVRQAFQSAAGAGGADNTYWIRNFGVSGSNVGNGRQNVTTDSSNNVIVCYRNSYIFVTKWDKDGNELWTYRWQGSGSTLDDPFAVKCDSNDNIYVAGRTTHSSSAGGQDMFLLKINSSGTLQWAKLWGETSTDNGRFIAIDSSDNILMGGTFFDAGDNQLGLIQFNSSGTLLYRDWWESTSGSGGHAVDSNAVYDSSGNLYVSFSSSSSQGDRAMLTKFNSSFTHQWTRRIKDKVGHDTRGHAVAVDSSGNPYLGYYNGYASNRTSDFFVTKFNSSGTAQWTRAIGDPSGGGNVFDVPQGMAFDSSDILHIWFRTTDATNGFNQVAAAAWNTSGTLQYDKYFLQSTSGALSSVGGMTVDGNDAIIGVGWGNVDPISGISYTVTVFKYPTGSTETVESGSPWQNADPNLSEYDGSSDITINNETLSNNASSPGTVSTSPTFNRSGPYTLSITSYEITP